MQITRVFLVRFFIILSSLLSCFNVASGTSLQDFIVKDGKGDSYPLSQFKDTPAVLIVNVASACGYTDSNYRELQGIRSRYDDKLAILAFPCNQFGRQEPGTWEEISAFVSENYGVAFPVLDKIDVNGPRADPLFKWLKETSGDPLDIPWNFSKFLVICGTEVKRFSHAVNPLEIENDIKGVPAVCPRSSAQEL